MRAFLTLTSIFVIALLSAGLSIAQRRDPVPSRPNGYTVYGDFEVDEKEADEHKPIAFTLILYTKSGITSLRNPKSD